MKRQQPVLSSAAAVCPAPGVRLRLLDTASRTWFRMPSRLRSTVGLLRQFVPAVLGRPIPVTWLHGPARPSGRSAVVLAAGAEPWIHYLPDRFFSEPPRRECIGWVSVWSLPRLLRRLRPRADLVIVRLDRLSCTMMRDGGWLRMPEWIGAALTLPQDLEALFRGKGSLREDLRRIRKNRLRPVISHLEADFDLFYKTMYAPYIRARYGDLGYVRPRHVVRQWFRRGGVLFVERDGERLAGLLFSLYRHTCYICVVGTRGGRYEPVRQGAMAAVWVFCIRHAAKLGCMRVEFGTSRPVLQDGVLRFKSKWGPRFYPSPSSLFDLLVWWDRFEGVVADFFSHTSLIFREKEGLAGIHATAAEHDTASAAHKSLWVNGLRQLYLVGGDAWPSGNPSPPRTVLLNGLVGSDFFSG